MKFFQKPCPAAHHPVGSFFRGKNRLPLTGKARGRHKALQRFAKPCPQKAALAQPGHLLLICV